MRASILGLRDRLLDWVATYQSAGTTDGGIPIPPVRLRAAGVHFGETQAFVRAGQRDARRLAETASLSPSSTLLDIGCGVGRLAIGICEELGGIERYLGVDVRRPVIAWAHRHLTSFDQRLHFQHLNVPNERYNPSGQDHPDRDILPIADDMADVVYSYSVFSHMRADDVERYLHEICRVLSSRGMAMFTAFVERGVPDEAVNPQDYGPRNWEGPLHCVRFNRDYFELMIKGAGLKVSVFEHQCETDGQSLYVVFPAVAGDAPESANATVRA